jgi:hypothetical protein
MEIAVEATDYKVGDFFSCVAISMRIVSFSRARAKGNSSMWVNGIGVRYCY